MCILQKCSFLFFCMDLSWHAHLGGSLCCHNSLSCRSTVSFYTMGFLQGQATGDYVLAYSSVVLVGCSLFRRISWYLSPILRVCLLGVFTGLGDWSWLRHFFTSFNIECYVVSTFYLTSCSSWLRTTFCFAQILLSPFTEKVFPVHLFCEDNSSAVNKLWMRIPFEGACFLGLLLLLRFNRYSMAVKCP